MGVAAATGGKAMPATGGNESCGELYAARATGSAPDTREAAPLRIPGDAVLATIADAIAVLDHDWRLIYVNETAARICRGTALDLVGRPIADLLRPDAGNPLLEFCKASRRNGKPAVFTVYSQLAAGWLEVRGYPHADGYTMIFRDVSETGLSDPSLREVERRIEGDRAINQRLFDTSLDLIMVVDRHDNYLRVSPSSESIVGWRPDEMIGGNAASYVHPNDLEHTRDEMRLARRGKLTRNFDCRYVHKNGQVVPMAWTGVWSEFEEQHFFIGRDMTDRTAAEERLRRSERLEAVGQLTGGVAHDFNNILTVILGTVDILSERLAGHADLAAIVEVIDEAAERGAEVTRQLLAFARKQPLQPRIVSVTELIRGSQELLRRALGEVIEIELKLGEDTWPAMADPSQLATALINLAINARDAMPEGGKLTIETGNTHIDEEYARANVEVQPGSYVLIAVSDTGAGVPASVLDKVFEPFFTTKESGRGTGLGLSMVYGFVKQSGGHVKMYSEEGYGTSVKIYLPRALREGEQAEPAAQPAQIRTGSETILVVEDEALVRNYVLTQLASLGYRTHSASNGPEALALVEAGVAFDLLLTDVIMPGGMTGRTLANEILKRRPRVKVLFTSGYTENAIVHHGRLDPGVLLLAKPYRKADLARMVREALGGDRQSE